MREHIRAWLKPIWDEIGFTDEELNADNSWKRGKPKPKQELQTDYAIEMLNNPDTPLHKLDDLLGLHVFDWESIVENDRQQLTEILLNHLDWTVRQSASGAFRAWGDQDSLMILMNDVERSVRREGILLLAKTPPFKPEIAEFAWTYMHERFDKDAGEYEGEVLTLYTAHADQEEAIPRLIAVAKNVDLTEDQRMSALYNLDGLEASEAIGQLMGVLSAPPPLTWDFHIKLLNLADVDHLHLQAAIAPFLGE